MDETRRLGVRISPADRFSSSIRREDENATTDAKRLMASFAVVAGVLAIAIGITMYIWHDVGTRDDLNGTPSARTQILEIENLLAELGFTPGAQDGVLDDMTIEAIRTYQQAAGLPQDGAATPALLEELKAVAGE